MSARRLSGGGRALAVAAGVMAITALVGGMAEAATPHAAHRAKHLPPAASRPTQTRWIAQQKAQAPLDTLANAVIAEGTHKYRASYSGAVLGSRRLLVYATSVAGGRRLLAAAQKAYPGINVRLAELRPARYSYQALEAAASRIMRLHGLVYSAGPTATGSGLSITAGHTARLAPRLAAAAGGIPVTVSRGRPSRLFTWRWNDTAPFIGGDVVNDGNALCTSGMAAENSSGTDYILTADHCFNKNETIYGEGDPVGEPFFSLGNRIGTVTITDEYVDSEAINTGKSNGAGSNSDEADQPQGKWYPVTADIYAGTGAGVCQDGDATYYNYDGQSPTPPLVPCDMKVVATGVDQTFDIHGTNIELQGDEASCNPYCGQPGDSGAMVFEVTDGTRKVVGDLTGAASNGDLFWVPAPVQLADIGLTLNPHT
jgi:hypothetical protein